MPEIKHIPNQSLVVIQGNSISITTSYDDGSNPYIISANIQPDGQGNLVVILNNFPVSSNAMIDDNGNFIIFIPQNQANAYYIDENGHLIFDENLI